MSAKKKDASAITTSDDIDLIVSGDRIEIDYNYPIDDPEPDNADGTFSWFMAQPVDWTYDMGQAVREAAVSECLALPEMDRVKKLPPTEQFVRRQEKARSDTQDRIDEIDAMENKHKLTPEQDLERENLKEHLNRIIDPEDVGSRADEIAQDRGTKAFESYLMPRLIETREGDLLFDPNSDEGMARWDMLGRGMKELLRAPFYEVLILVTKAKNFNTGQS